MVYESLKRKMYGNAAAITGVSGDNVYAEIMRDSDSEKQQLFLTTAIVTLSQKQRQTLLDGLAREYAGVNGWGEYWKRECA